MIELNKFGVRVAILALLAALLLAGCKKKEEEAAGGGTADASVPDCSAGFASADIAASVPAWIQVNFNCIKATMDGETIVIQTRNQPPYASYYYGSGHASYDSTTPEIPNPNKIAAKNFTFRIPSAPALAASTSKAGGGPLGVAVDGVVIFNNEARAPDVLVNEQYSLDSNTGHPTGDGTYHYHVAMSRLASGEAGLIGIAIDGFPIFGRKEADGSLAFDYTVTASKDNWASDHTHGVVSSSFPASVPHYHIVSNYTEVDTIPGKGATVELPYIISEKLAGNRGALR